MNFQFKANTSAKKKNLLKVASRLDFNVHRNESDEETEESYFARKLTQSALTLEDAETKSRRSVVSFLRIEHLMHTSIVIL